MAVLHSRRSPTPTMTLVEFCVDFNLQAVYAGNGNPVMNLNNLLQLQVHGVYLDHHPLPP